MTDNNPPARSKAAQVKSVADWITKIGGAAAVLTLVGGGGMGLALPWVQDALGVTQLRRDFDIFSERVVGALDRLTPKPKIAIYDSAESYQEGTCHLRSECAVRFRLRRTAYGAGCKAPELQPWLRNHAGTKHAAEALSPAIRVDRDWTILISRFIAPREAKPGRATYVIDLTYECRDGSVFERTPPVPIILSPPRE